MTGGSRLRLVGARAGGRRAVLRRRPGASCGRAVRRHLARAPAPTHRPDRRSAALIAPHAGYRYSGATAGAGWARLAPAGPRRPERVVLLGPSHRVPVEPPGRRGQHRGRLARRRSATCRSTATPAADLVERRAWPWRPTTPTPPSTASRCTCRSCSRCSAPVPVVPLVAGRCPARGGGRRARRAVGRRRARSSWCRPTSATTCPRPRPGRATTARWPPSSRAASTTSAPRTPAAAWPSRPCCWPPARTGLAPSLLAVRTSADTAGDATAWSATPASPSRRRRR